MKDFDYKNYLKSNPLLKEEYKLGAKFSKDFDYDGMVRMGLSMDENSDVEDLQALYNSFEDVNYHSENQNLGLAIDALRDGEREEAEIFIGDFHDDLQDLARSFGMEDIMKKVDYNLGIGDERLGEKKDHDGDGDIDSDDYLAARDKAIKRSMAKKKPKKENIDTKLAEIGKAAEITKMEAQLEFLHDHIDEKINRLSSIQEDENLKELVDKKKMKDMQKEIKLLEKRKAKMEKLYEKHCGKKFSRKEMVDEMDAVSWNEKNNPTRGAAGERDPKKVGQSTSAYAVNK